MPTQAELETELEAVFTAMQALRAGEKQIMYKGRSITRNDLAELRDQYEWLQGKINKAAAGGKRTAVAAFQEPSA